MPEVITGQGGPSVPSEVTRYRCNLCHGVHDSLTMATICEEMGPGPEYPIGLIFGDQRPQLGDGTPNERANLAYAVARNNPAGHSNWFFCFAAGPEPSPLDVLPPKMTNHLHAGRLGPEEATLRPDSVAVIRLAAALRAECIPPLVWTCPGWVSYDEWQARHAAEASR